MGTEKLWKIRRTKLWKVKVFCDIWMGGTFGMASDKMINLMFFGFLISSASTFQSGRFVLPFYVFVDVDDAVITTLCYWCCWLLFKLADFSNFPHCSSKFPLQTFSTSFLIFICCGCSCYWRWRYYCFTVDVDVSVVASKYWYIAWIAFLFWFYWSFLSCQVQWLQPAE